jgi:hypothetical protein
MSISLMAEAWKLDLEPACKLVLLALADWANDDGLCWPSVNQLRTKCGVSERTVQAAIRKLCGAGFLSRDENPGKGVFYTVHPRKSCTPAKSAPPQNLRQTPAKSAPNTTNTHQLGNVCSREREAEFLSAWNAMAEANGLPVAKGMNADRRRKLVARVQDHGWDEVAGAVARVPRSSFLTGKTGDWRASIDFILQASSFQKLIEGNYDDGQRGLGGHQGDARAPQYRRDPAWDAFKALRDEFDSDPDGWGGDPLEGHSGGHPRTGVALPLPDRD